MKSHVLLSSNLPSVIDRSNFSPSHEGKLLDHNAQLFIFISILLMTQLHPRDPEKQTTKTDFRNGASREKKLQPVEWKAWRIG